MFVDRNEQIGVADLHVASRQCIRLRIGQSDTPFVSLRSN
jgi:hypothetical protein